MNCVKLDLETDFQSFLRSPFPARFTHVGSVRFITSLNELDRIIESLKQFEIILTSPCATYSDTYLEIYEFVVSHAVLLSYCVHWCVVVISYHFL
jgi:hypothetical protein